MLRACAVLLALGATLLPAPPATASAGSGDGPLLVVVSEPDRPVGRSSLRAAGADLVRAVPALSAQLVRADGPGAAARLAARPGVRYVEPLARRTALADAATPERAELALDEAAALLPEGDGRGTVVAVLDTGVDAANPDLAGRVSDGGDFTSGSRRSGGTVDDNGHGTGVAALAAAAADGEGMVGSAPAAHVRSYKVLDGDGIGGSLGLALAIRQVADDAAAGLPVVVANMSLGGAFRSRVETEALAHAARVAPQVLFVAASGNDGGRRPSFPAGFPGVLSVGASQQDADGVYRRAAFSTTADVDVLAPGVDVLTYDYVPGRQPPALGRVSGTSEAAPAVAGLVAGLASGRGVRGQHAAALLKASAEPASPGGAAGDGSGRADALAAAALGDGARGYSTVVADLGAQVEPGTVRALVAQRFVPHGRAAVPPALQADAGRLEPGPSRTEEVAGGRLVTQRWSFALPGPAQGAWRVRGAGDEVGDDVPFSGLDPLEGERGRPVRSGERVRSRLGEAGRLASLVSFSVQAGQVFTLRGTGPADGTGLFLWSPPAPGGTASSFDEPVEQVALVDGAARYRAPLTGRYVVGHLSPGSGVAGTSEVQVDHPEPAARVRAPAVSTAGTAGLPFRVSWAGGQSYEVQWAARTRTATGWVAGPWRTWLRGTTATTAVFGAGGVPTTVLPGTTYLLRAVASDGLGGVGAPSAPVAVAVPYDERATGLRWGPGWSAVTAEGRFLRTLRTTATRGAGVTLTLEAGGFSVVADRGPGHGQVDVVLDGVRVARVDTGATALVRRAVVWRSGPLAGGVRSRTLRLVAVGTRGRPRVAVDAVAVHR